MEHSIQDRIEGAIWGLFVANSLAMPIHWYYNRKNITSDFPGGVTQFEAPRHPHPEAFMIGMRYRPDVETAQKLGRPYDIARDPTETPSPPPMNGTTTTMGSTPEITRLPRTSYES